MFEPNLDSGSSWQPVGVISSPTGVFNYTPEISLNIRTDAVLVDVTMDTTRDSWDLAGSMVQLWEVSANKYQTKYSKIWLKQKTIFPIEPLGHSILVFKPVTWLSNWTLNIQARPYQPATIAQDDIAEIDQSLDLLQQQVSIGFSDLRTNVADSFSSGAAQRVDIATQLNQITSSINVLSQRIEDLHSQSGAT